MLVYSGPHWGIYRAEPQQDRKCFLCPKMVGDFHDENFFSDDMMDDPERAICRECFVRLGHNDGRYGDR